MWLVAIKYVIAYILCSVCHIICTGTQEQKETIEQQRTAIEELKLQEQCILLFFRAIEHSIGIYLINNLDMKGICLNDT